MKHYTLTLNSAQLAQLEKIYLNHKLDNNNEFVLFAAMHNDNKVIAYKSGKVVFQGEDIINEITSIKASLKIYDYEAIGADEVGTGDVFGPVVVCSVYTSLDDLRYLENMGVRDSKTMNDAKIKEVGPKLASKLTYSLIILDPIKYNEITKKGYNLNKIKALLHNSSIIKTTAKINRRIPVILDQFCKPDLYFSYLKDEKFKYSEIEFHTKAESFHLSVAAASIIARYAFLAKLHELGKEISVKLIKGAGVNVDEQISSLLSKKIDLNKIAKMNFKNITKLTV